MPSSADFRRLLAVCTLTLATHCFAAVQSPKAHRHEIVLGKRLAAAKRIDSPERALAAYEAVYKLAKKYKNFAEQGNAAYDCGIKCEELLKWEAGIGWFAKALAGYVSAGWKDEQADCYGEIGSCERKIRRLDKSLQDFSLQLKLRRESRDLKGQASALVDIADAYTDLGRYQEAGDADAQAAAIQKKSGDRVGEANSVMYMGEAYARLGSRPRALAILEPASEALKRAGDKSGEARALNDLAILYSYLGLSAKAREANEEAASLEHLTGDRSGEANTLANIGTDLQAHGHVQEALVYLKNALAIQRKLNDPWGQSSTLNSLGKLYADLGEHRTSLSYYFDALPLQRQTLDRTAEATTLSNIGSTYAESGQLETALHYFSLSLTLQRQLGNLGGQANSLNDLGAAYGWLGKYKKELEFLNQALPIQRVIGDRYGEATTLKNVGAAYSDLGEPHKALDYYERSLALRRIIGDRSGEAATLGDLEVALEDLDLPDLAIVFGKESVNVYQSLRQELADLPEEEQKTYRTTVEPRYRDLADLLIKNGRLEEAQRVMDLLKERENFDFVRRDAKRLTKFEDRLETVGIENGWWEAYRKIADHAVEILTEEFDLEQKSAKLKKEGSLLSAEESRHLADLQEEQSTISSQTDVYFGLVREQAASLGAQLKKQIEERMDSVEHAVLQSVKEFHSKGTGIAAVYAVESTDQLHFILVTPAGYSNVDVPVSSEKLNILIAEFRQNLTDPSLDPRPNGKALYDLVFSKLMKQLEDAHVQRVMWCLDGSLRYIPLQAIWDGEHYLVERRDLTFTLFDPLNMPVIAESPNPKSELAAFSDSKGKPPKYPPLPGADQELNDVLYQPEKGFNGVMRGYGYPNEKFTVDSLKASMTDEETSLLHVATHFDLGEDFSSSYLLLGDGTELSLDRLMSWTQDKKLSHLDLICLSACDTASTLGGKEVQGSQLDSFVSLTFAAGAKSVLASLWPVSDASTPLLMKLFYQNWKARPDLGKAEALRSAQISLLRGNSGSDNRVSRAESVTGSAHDGVRFLRDPAKPFSHPYYWAPFVLFGNWQ